MAHETSKVTGLAIDNSTGTLTDISGSVNMYRLNRAFEELEDTGLGDTTKSYIDGLGDAPRIPLNGHLNSTTRAIFAPLAAENTSVSTVKTLELKLASGDYWTGEAIVNDVELSVGVGQLNAWSCNLRAQSALTQTSVTAVS